MVKLALGRFARIGPTGDSKPLKLVFSDLRPLGLADPTICSAGSCELGEASLAINTDLQGPEGLETSGHLVFAGNIRLENRSELMAELGLTCILGDPDKSIALAAYRKWGERSVERLLGDFGFAIWDGLENSLFLARDRLGVYPLYFSLTNDRIVFGSDLGALALFDEVSTEPDREWIANTTACVTLPDLTERTSLKDARLLRNARTLLVGPDRICEREYWSLGSDIEILPETEYECFEHFRGLFHDAVHSRLPVNGSVGLELSAGLDSSAIAATVATGDFDLSRLKSFSHVGRGFCDMTDDVPIDEKTLTENLGATLGLGSINWISGPEYSAAELLRFPLCGQGTEAWSIFAQPLYERARQMGCRVLLSGAGGDELVSSQAGQGYWEFFLKGEYTRLWREIEGEGVRKDWGAKRKVRRLLSSFLHAGFPSLASVLGRVPPGQFDHFLNPEVARQFSIEERKREFYHLLVNGRLRRRQKRLLSGLYLSSLRLPQSFALAFWNGVEVRYPMLDTRLIEYCYSLPADCLRRGGYGRALIRFGLSDIPNEIRWRDDKSVPAVPWFEPYLVEQGRNLESSVLGEPKLVDTFDLESIREQLKLWASGSCSENPIRTRSCVLSIAAASGAL